MSHFVRVTGNRAVLSTAMFKREETGGGLILHGATACCEKARAILDLVERYNEHLDACRQRRFMAPFLWEIREHRMIAANNFLYLTLFSSIPGEPQASLSLCLSSKGQWLQLAGELLSAAEAIQMNERATRVPVFSEWKQTPGTPQLTIEEVAEMFGS